MICTPAPGGPALTVAAGVVRGGSHPEALV